MSMHFYVSELAVMSLDEKIKMSLLSRLSWRIMRSFLFVRFFDCSFMHRITQKVVHGF